MSYKNNKNLAEQIAGLLKDNEQLDDLNAIRSGIEKLSERLDGFERKIGHADRQPASFPHPSLEKFDVVEAVADQIIEHHENEKTCTFEPNGKPCDHCSMCSSRGF